MKPCPKCRAYPIVVKSHLMTGRDYTIKCTTCRYQTSWQTLQDARKEWERTMYDKEFYIQGKTPKAFRTVKHKDKVYAYFEEE